MKKINSRIVYSALIALGSVSILLSCNKQQEGATMPPMEVPVAKVEQGNGLVQKEYPASIQGVTDVEIRPQVSGYLQKILVDEGAYVRAGQPLFKIDDRIYAEQYNTAMAAVSVAKANLANAKIDLDRRKTLVKENIVSDLQTQQAQATYNAALATLDQAQAQAKSAKINYQFCTITAPVSGYLGKFNYRLGSLMGPANPQAITVLSDIHQVNAYFSMSESDFLEFQKKNEGATIEEKIKNSALVDLKIADGQSFDVKGKIDAIEGQFNLSTGSVSFRAKFNNPKALLRAGNTGKIITDQHYSDILLIPIASTFSVQDKVYVFSVDQNNKVLQLPLEIIGKTGDNYMLSSGIKKGDSYIVSGFERLQPGMTIVPMGKSKK